uniref:PH domain-containing protein n=1 Tax=Globisporangium ultimum (strain ATCC 200006 / CBS 805.95 / DAOM BR144) TaxID=431595 RepID=K3XBZ9_GLOUD
MVSTDTVLHKGLLFKKGSGVGYPFGRRNWRTRHFVLTARQLTYYTYEDGKWRGALDLTTCVDVNDKTQNRAIEVMPTDSPKTGSSASTIWRIAVNTRERRMLVAATSEREMNEWVEMLTLAIQINHKKLYIPRAIVQRMSLPDTASSGVSDSLVFVADYHPMSNREPRTSIDGQRKILQAEAEAEVLTRQQDEQFNDEVHQLLIAIHAKRTRR